jgi:hypothetical protein
MAATIQIRRQVGAGPTNYDITSINTRLSTSDNHYTTQTTNPIPIPPSGTKYSFWAPFQLYAATTPAGTIDNIKWYSDGTDSLGTGISMKVASANVYDQATGTTGDTGDELTVAAYGNGTTDLDAAPVDAFGKTSGAPFAITGSITNPSTGNFGDLVVVQSAVISTASAGTTPTETITWKYDET